ncbi:hypothetical protein PR048_032140 [Dryococelus australis]|uniref:WD repeat-containing protein 55 homolog n=1 Tax=Dryococelus australis TaxID=614101 RepID=A0ABQ9G2K0_9NEOP|nr:hypothetical protein PR048_032140 [Dryococelus australis]
MNLLSSSHTTLTSSLVLVPTAAIACNIAGDYQPASSASTVVVHCVDTGACSREDHATYQPTVLFKRTKHHKGSIYCLAWTPMGDLMATGSNDKTVKLMRFNPDTSNLEGEAACLEWEQCAACTPGDRADDARWHGEGPMLPRGHQQQVESADKWRRWGLQDLRDRLRDRHALPGSQRSLRQIGLDSRRGCSLIFACANRARRYCWSVGFLGYLQFHSPLYSDTVPYSPHATLISSQDLDEGLSSRSAGTVVCIGDVCCAAGHVLTLYNWGGAMFVSGSQDKTVRFWDLRTRGCVNMVTPVTVSGTRQQGSPVAAVCVDPSGRLLVSGHEDSSCVLYDICGQRSVQGFRPHSADVRSIRFSPSAYYLLTAGYDNKLVLTDLQGDLTLPLPSVVVAQHQDKVISGRWHPTEFSFLSTSADKTATLWALPPV